jgi:hypothetical protein
MNRPTRNTLLGCCLCLVIVSLYSCAARAEKNVSNGNFMLPYCEHYISNNYPYGVWEGECGGIVSALMYFGSSLEPSYKFCPPREANNGQAGRVVVNYMKQHPELLHLNFQGLAATALRTAWPCK